MCLLKESWDGAQVPPQGSILSEPMILLHLSWTSLSRLSTGDQLVVVIRIINQLEQKRVLTVKWVTGLWKEKRQEWGAKTRISTGWQGFDEWLGCWEGFHTNHKAACAFRSRTIRARSAPTQWRNQSPHWSGSQWVHGSSRFVGHAQHISSARINPSNAWKIGGRSKIQASCRWIPGIGR